MAKNKVTTILAFDFVINTALTVIELGSGYVSGSIALSADGFQNLTDSIVLSIAYIAERLIKQKRLSNTERRKIYRWAGCANALILMLLSIYVAFNSVHRLLNPQSINAKLVIAVGILSILINFLAAGLLFCFRNKKNIRAPYIGLLFSGLSGVGVLISGLATYFLHIHSIDAVAGLIIAAVLLLRSTNLFKRSIKGG